MFWNDFQSNAWLLIVAVVILLVIVIFACLLLIRHKRRRMPRIATTEISSYIEALGGIDNIVNVTSSQSRLQVKVIDGQVIDTNKLKVLGASGIMKTSSKVTIVIGKLSAQLALQIEAEIKGNTVGKK